MQLSDDLLASVSLNDESNPSDEDEKKSEEEDEFPDQRPVLYNHAIDLLQEVKDPADPDSCANCVPCLPELKKMLMQPPEMIDENSEIQPQPQNMSMEAPKTSGTSSYSTQNYIANKINSDDIGLMNYLRETFEVERRQYVEQLDKLNDFESKKDDKTIKKLQRKIWVIDGFLKHNLNHKILTEIAANFKKIDSVPNGYYYPELFASDLSTT